MATLTSTGIAFSNGDALDGLPTLFSTFSGTSLTGGTNLAFDWQQNVSDYASNTASWKVYKNLTFQGKSGSVVRLRCGAAAAYSSDGKSSGHTYVQILKNGVLVLSYNRNVGSYAYSAELDVTLNNGDVLSFQRRAQYNYQSPQVHFRLGVGESYAVGALLFY
jgi:hypothetical protein